MKPLHALLAVFIAAIWGFNFVVIKVGLQTYPPLMLGFLRFVVAALPTLFIARPRNLSWPHLFWAGSSLFLGQTGFMFVAIYVGMPPGLASIVIQVQAFLTMAFGYFALGEIPGRRQLGGAVVAAIGLSAIGLSVAGPSGGGSVAGFVLMLAAGTSWAVGNVLLRGGPKTDMLATIVWLSMIPPVPLLLLSFLFEGNAAVDSLLHPTLLGMGAVAYLGGVATVFGFGAWGYLLKLYPAGTVAPFAIAVPAFGAASAATVFGERFGLLDLSGMALVLAGLLFLTRSARRCRSAPD